MVSPTDEGLCILMFKGFALFSVRKFKNTCLYPMLKNRKIRREQFKSVRRKTFFFMATLVA